jgi:hypothetical protein
MATTAESPTREPAKFLGADARIALGVVAVCLALVLAVRLVARDAPSAGRSIVVGLPPPVVSSAEGCTNIARFWIVEAGTGVSAETIEGMTNCRQAADGTWFVPSGGDDPRLPAAPVLTEEQQAATAALRADIVAQIDGLEAQFPSTLRLWLSQLYDPFPRAAWGHIRDGPSIRTPRGRYTRLIQAYLMAPDHQELADYVGWIMARRLDAYDDLRTKCFGDPDLAYLRTVCRGLEDTLGIRYPPFVWDLADPYLLDAYLASTLATTEATPATGS